MKIVRFPKPRIAKDFNPNETMKRDNICPFCGKELSFCDRSFRMFNKTTGDGVYEPFIFHTYTVDVYTCSRCYAVWETDPYEENPFKKNGFYKLADLIKYYTLDLLGLDYSDETCNDEDMKDLTLDEINRHVEEYIDQHTTDLVLKQSLEIIIVIPAYRNIKYTDRLRMFCVDEDIPLLDGDSPLTALNRVPIRSDVTFENGTIVICQSNEVAKGIKMFHRYRYIETDEVAEKYFNRDKNETNDNLN